MREFAIADVPTGRLNALVKNLMRQAGINDPGEVIRRINASELILVNRLIMKQLSTDSSAFPTFMRLVLPVRTNTTQLFTALRVVGENVTGYAEDLISRTQLVAEPTIVELVVVTPNDLGLKCGGTTEQIYANAFKRGLDLCPAQVGPELGIACRDQPKHTQLLVAMEQIMDRYKKPSAFMVLRESNGHYWLDGQLVRSFDTWHGNRRWVFIRRRHIE